MCPDCLNPCVKHLKHPGHTAAFADTHLMSSTIDFYINDMTVAPCPVWAERNASDGNETEAGHRFAHP